jgi:hypothetical protein
MFKLMEDLGFLLCQTSVSPILKRGIRIFTKESGKGTLVKDKDDRKDVQIGMVDMEKFCFLSLIG